MDGRMDGRESGVKDCLQQSTNYAFSYIFGFVVMISLIYSLHERWKRLSKMQKRKFAEMKTKILKSIVKVVYVVQGLASL